MANKHKGHGSQHTESGSSDSKTKTQGGYLKRTHFFSKPRLIIFGVVFAAVGAFFLFEALAAGTTIVVNSGSWVCDRPLEEYGELPITIEHTIKNGSPQQNGAVRLMSGCTAQNSGGADGNIDLILHINGNGTTIGSANDGMALIGAHDIDVSGYVNCGAISGGAHQDGVQMNTAFRINFIDFTSADWGTQVATCFGAGGIWYVSQLNDIPNLLQDVVCIRCKLVGTKAGGGANGTAFGHYGSLRSGGPGPRFSAH